MPFKSDKQRKYMWINHPEIAKKWTMEENDNPMVKALRKRRKKKT